MRAELLTPEVRAYHDTPTELRFEVTNTSDVVDSIHLDLPDLDDGWIVLPEADLALFPDTRQEVSVLLTVPASYPAGRYQVMAELRSSTDAAAVSQHFVDVHVAGAAAAELTLRPALQTGGRTGRFRATVTNSGTTELDLHLVASDPARALEFVIEPHYAVLEPGRSVDVTMTAVGRRPWFGNPQSHAISLNAEGGDQRLQAAATFLQKPWIPRGVITALVLAGIVLLWALIFRVGVGRATAREAFGKEIPATLLSGQTELDRTVVAGTLGGVVRAANTGKGLARVTVEAHRVTRDGTELTASAATGDDGAYRMGGLYPGRYLLRVTAPGFAETWYPASPTPDGAEQLRVVAQGVATDLDVTVGGIPGSISGKVSAASVAKTAPIVNIRVRPRSGDVLGAPLAAPTVAADGSFTVPGLATPGAYQLTISSLGFVDQTLEVVLAGGEEVVVNTVRLVAGPGSISGIVSARGGAPLGGVVVTASRGEFTLKTTTPTVGQIGAYELVGLETPGTYVVTYQLAGYGVQTLALDLGPGERRAAVDVGLVGGSGNVAGQVRDPAGNPVGGVTVKAVSGEFSLSTQSLTGGNVGSYALTGLRTPATYTVSFELAGYNTETRLLVLDTAAAAPGFDVVLSPSVGTIGGVLKVAGVETGGVAVTVTDGATSHTTSTASSPAGAYEVGALAPGSYTVTFTVPGRRPYIVLAAVTAGKTTTLSPDINPPAGTA